MSITTGKQIAPASPSDAMAGMSQGLFTATRSYERLMTGWLATMVRQAEFSRDMMAGACDDIGILAQAHTPQTFVQAELQVMQRRTERMFHGAKRLAEEIGKEWVSTLGAVERDARANGDAATKVA